MNITNRFKQRIIYFNSIAYQIWVFVIGHNLSHSNRYTSSRSLFSLKPSNLWAQIIKRTSLIPYRFQFTIDIFRHYPSIIYNQHYQVLGMAYPQKLCQSMRKMRKNNINQQQSSLQNMFQHILRNSSHYIGFRKCHHHRLARMSSMVQNYHT